MVRRIFSILLSLFVLMISSVAFANFYSVKDSGWINMRNQNTFVFEATGEPLKITYGLEYGSDTITIPENLLKPTDRVVIVDDLLATGGTICALAKLCKSTGAKVVGAVTFIELEGLDGKKVLAEEEVPFEAPLLL